MDRKKRGFISLVAYSVYQSCDGRNSVPLSKFLFFYFFIFAFLLFFSQEKRGKHCSSPLTICGQV